MTPRFEAFVARLYVDRHARARFLADPDREAAAAGLAGAEISAALGIDRAGLELAARSFEQKKRRQNEPAHPLLRWFRRVSERVLR